MERRPKKRRKLIGSVVRECRFMSTPSGKPFDPFDLSPYAPKRARERSVLDRPSVGNDISADNVDGHDDNGPEEAAVLLPYAPRAAMRRGGTDGGAGDLDGAVQAPSESVPDTAARPVTEKAIADEMAADPDLARLESSLQWLQREGSVGRLPRAVQLPPVSGLRPVGPDGPRPHGERFINGVRVPPSLPSPMRERRDNLRRPFRVF